MILDLLLNKKEKQKQLEAYLLRTTTVELHQNQKKNMYTYR